MIVPVFIHIHEKSDKELREEMERDRRFRESVERDERTRRERENAIKREKELKKHLAYEKAEADYRRRRDANPWDFTFLPEGWSIFGTPLKIISDI